MFPPAVATSAVHGGPEHLPGAHTRAGNAMGRTRAGLLAGAARAFADNGLRRSTMQSIAVAAGVAKATLYNHFRTKDEVASALLAVELDRLSALAAGLPRAEALAALSDELGAHPVLRRLAGTEPETLTGLLSVDAGRWADLTTRLGAALRCGRRRCRAGRPLAARRGAAAGAVDGAGTGTRNGWRPRWPDVSPAAASGSAPARSSPGPAWSRDRWALAPSAVWKAVAAASSVRVTAWTTRAPVLPARSSNQAHSRRPRPDRRWSLADGEQVQVGQPVGGHDAEAGIRRPPRRPSSPARRSRRTGENHTGWCSPRVSVSQKRSCASSKRARTAVAGHLGEADDADGVRRHGHRSARAAASSARVGGSAPTRVQFRAATSAASSTRRSRSSSAHRLERGAVGDAGVEQAGEQARGQRVAGPHGVDDGDRAASASAARRARRGRSAAERRRR